MVRLDGVEVVEDGASSFPGDDEFTLEGELSDLVEADAEDLGRFECRDLVIKWFYFKFVVDSHHISPLLSSMWIARGYHINQP